MQVSASGAPKALELLGISEDRILGITSFAPDWNVIREDGSPFPGPTHPVPQAIATLKPVHQAVMGVFRHTSGDRVWLLVDAQPLFDFQGSLSHVLCTFIEITKRKIAEAQVQALLAEKDLILAEMHHPIQNNMSTLISFLSLQESSSPNPEAVEALRDAEGRIRSMMVP